LPIQLNSVGNIDPLYNLDDYAKESKFRVELAHKRAKLMLDNNIIKQKIRYDLETGDKALLNNETGHKLDFSYTGPYTITELGARDNITILSSKHKKKVVHKDRLKICIS